MSRPDDTASNRASREVKYSSIMPALPKHELPFTVIKADIGTLAKSGGPWLAVVSSDDSYLSHRGGSSLAVWSAANLPEDLPRQFPLPIPLASVVASMAGKLEVGSILHAVTLDLDTRARLDINQCAELFGNLHREIARLAQGTEPRDILMPLVGAGSAGVPLGAIADQIAVFVARLQPIGVRCTIAVSDDAVAVSKRLQAGYGLIEVPIDLEEWIKVPDYSSEVRLTYYCRAVDYLLREIAVWGAKGQPGSATIMEMWGVVHAKIQEAKHANTPSDALELIPEVTGFRNRAAHGLPLLKPDVIAANMAESALKGLLSSVKLGLFAGLDPAKVKHLLALEMDNELMAWRYLRRWRRPVDQVLLKALLRNLKPDLRLTTNAWIKAVEELKSAKIPTQDTSWMDANKGELLAAPLKLIFQAPGDPRELPVPSLDLEPALSAIPIPPSSNPVRELAKVLAALPSEDRNDLLSKLDEMDYRGDEDKRLVEYCTRTDPTVILEELGARPLREILRTRFDITARRTDSIQALRDRLLEQLGFKIPPEPTGLTSTLAALKKHRAELDTAGSDAIHGKVIRGSAQLELTIRNLLRFLCLYLFSEGPEQHFKPNGAAASDFSKATLGTLLHCLEMLAKEIDKLAKSQDETKALKELGGPLSATRLAPEGIVGITKLRNSFAHFEGERSEHDQRGQAHEFFSLAEALLEYWHHANPPIYPTIVVVEEIKFDRWNRRIVTARTDQIRAELIVSDDQLKPGEAYFMYPLSNPMRVDPILIAFHPDD